MNDAHHEVFQNEESYFHIFSPLELKDHGFDEERIQALERDPHQYHAEGRKGFLGALVLNYLMRHQLVEANEEHVNAYLISLALGTELSIMLQQQIHGKPLVAIQNEECYVPISYLHHLVDDGRDAKDLSELVKRYQQSRSAIILKTIGEKSRPIIESIAVKMVGRLPAHCDIDEIIADGYLGLFDAIQKYDADKKVKFENYAFHRIRGQIIDELRNADHLKRGMREKIKGMESFIEEYLQQNNRQPGYSELEDAWVQKGNKREDFATFPARMWESSSIVSLNNMTLEDAIEDPRANPEIQIRRKELLQIVEEDLKYIPHRTAFRAFLLEGATLAEAAATENLSESCICQLLKNYVHYPHFFRRTKEYLEVNKTVKLHI